MRELTAAGFTAYWAGGCVRDLLRGIDPNDYDVATNARPEQVRALFGPRRTLAVGESFGVIIVLGPKGSTDKVEVATFRQEGDYHDGRRPGQVSFCTPEEDALRRDFTINGMFFDPLTETVHDFVGGQGDLQRRLVRAIGNPRDRMTEDKLRMLRAVRFAAVLDFELDAATAHAVAEMSAEVTIVSAERIAQELRKMLADRHRARAMQMCADLSLLQQIVPEADESSIRGNPERWQSVLQILGQLSTTRFETAFAALLRDVPQPKTGKQRLEPASGTVLAACLRLKLSNDETDHICWLSDHRGAIEALPEKPLCEFKKLAVHPLYKELFELERVAARVEGRPDAAYGWAEALLKAIPSDELDPPPLVTGRDLLARGLKSGPKFKDWLNAIRDAQLNGEIRTQGEAFALLGRLLGQ
ncbi:poly(A) polymerase [Planctomicrobium piriforme]|uniref:Poly(A) polymerase n=1 Tax=Planctomicrobium piriforme TaxID=1576369 RepID=A0A1I3K199_9PLAN|nr:poly(A) polymerase [Planctomicrobium piriforme]